jgi:hypothetical protein
MNCSEQERLLLLEVLERYSVDLATVDPDLIAQRLRLQGQALALWPVVFSVPAGGGHLVLEPDQRLVIMGALSSRIGKYREAAWRCETVPNHQLANVWRKQARDMEAVREKIAGELFLVDEYPGLRTAEQNAPETTEGSGDDTDLGPQPPDEDPRLLTIHTGHPG